MKVLFVAGTFPSFLPVGHSIRVVKFIKYLPALGWLPVVLTINDRNEYETVHKMGSETLLSEFQSEVKIYRTTSGEPSLSFLERERGLSQRNRLTGVIVKLLKGIRRWTLRNILLPDRYLAWLFFAVWQGYRIMRNEKIDVIFATCPPHSSTLVGAVLKLFTSEPLILDYRDDWIDAPWHLSRSTLIRLIERRMESWVTNMADKVILVTEYSRKEFQHRYLNQPADKFIFIPNGCDLSEFAILNSKAETVHNSKFTILHAGSLNISKYWGRNLEEFFLPIQQILCEQPELAEKLDLIFAGDFPEEYSKLADKLSLSGVIKKIGHVPHDKVLHLIRSADLLLAINYEGWSTLIPGKIYEYWAVGGPLILLLSCPGAASNFLEQHQLGYTLEPSDVDGIRKKILDIYHRAQTSTPLRVSINGIEEYDRQFLGQKLALVLANLVDV